MASAQTLGQVLSLLAARGLRKSASAYCVEKMTSVSQCANRGERQRVTEESPDTAKVSDTNRLLFRAATHFLTKMITPLLKFNALLISTFIVAQENNRLIC